MLPPATEPAEAAVGALKEESKFCAELFLRIAGRGSSDIGGLDGGMDAW